MVSNKIFTVSCCLLVCLTIVFSSPIPVEESALPEVVALIPSIQSNIESNVRVARHLYKQKHHGCKRCGGGGYGGGGYGGSGSFAGASAGSFGSNSNAQSHAASFGFGPFSASFASSFAGSNSGGYYGFKK